MVEIWPQYLLALMAGLIAGSFTTTLIYRLPKIQDARNAPGREDDPPELSMWWPGSHCPVCATPLAVLDLVPLLSWIFLRGRCRHCQAPIPAHYPKVEAGLAILACLLVANFGFGVEALSGLVFVTCLVALSVIDSRTLTLPDVLTLSLLWAGLLVNVMDLFTDLASAVIGAFVGYAVLWGVYQVHRLLRGIEGLGYGDFKLLAGIGAWLGWQDLALVVMVGALSGLVWALVRHKREGLRATTEIPFGPFLALGGLVGLFMKEPLVWLGMRSLLSG